MTRPASDVPDVQLDPVAREALAVVLRADGDVALSGDLGAGKTTFQRRASPGYLVSLGLGLTGFFFLAVAVQSRMLLNAGGQPADAIDHAGAIGLLVAFAVTFVFRLVFWAKVPPSIKAAVRSFLQLTMAALVIATIAGAVFIGSRVGNGGAIPVTFLTFAVISQVATLIWLGRYRRE